VRGPEGEERRACGAEEVLTRAARRPFLGHGIGLRREHYAAILAGESAGDWLEAISENYMGVGGRARSILLALRERYPMTLHGVSLGIGGTDPVDQEYLDALKALAADVEPAWVSDHLCWTGVGGRTSHDLLPLPYTEESLANVVSRVAHVQERLGRPVVLENVSSYVGYRVSTIPENEFVAEVARQSGCGILLDVNNVFVSATNHGYDAREYLAAIPAGSVWQLHLAGPSEMGPLLVDTHDHPVRPEVWDLYREAVARYGEVSTLVEWDDHIPDLAVVRSERDRAAAIAAEVRDSIAGGTTRGTTKGSVPFSVETEIGTDPGTATRVARRIENQDLTPIFRLFFDLATAPEGVTKTMGEREARGDGVRAEVAGLFAGDSRMTAEERLDVYANMYFFRLRDVLAEDFARTAAALGEDRWHNLVTDYLVAHPPTRWSLRWAGEALPGFLRGYAEIARRPWLADVAALEWARNEAFQAVDADPMRLEDLVNVHPEVWPALTFGAAPGTALVASRWDLAAWWEGGGAEPPVEAPGGQVLLVWRDEADDVQHEALRADDVEPLRRLLASAPFADVCEACAPAGAGEADAEEAGRKAVELLRRWGSVLRSTLYGT
jgi:hypothetical protein